MGGDTESAPIDLGESEGRVVGRDQDVGVAGDPDAASEAVAVHRRDDRDLTVVDRRERLVAAPVHPDEALLRGIGRELLDVDAHLERTELRVRGHDHDADVGIPAGVPDRVGELEPTRDRECVHRRVVDHDLRDMVAHLEPDHLGQRT